MNTLLPSPRFEETVVHSTFPPAVARLHFTVWFPKAPQRGGLYSCMKSASLPSQDYLTECFTYYPLTGILQWKSRPKHHFRTPRGSIVFNCQVAGTIAGHKHFNAEGVATGIHVTITLNDTQQTMYAHHIIMLLMGCALTSHVDHKDGNPFNNQWTNLRLATRSQNGANRRLNLFKASTLPKGVWQNGNHFSARITIDGKRLHLGTYATPEVAHDIYYQKAVELFGPFANHG